MSVNDNQRKWRMRIWKRRRRRAKPQIFQLCGPTTVILLSVISFFKLPVLWSTNFSVSKGPWITFVVAKYRLKKIDTWNSCGVVYHTPELCDNLLKLSCEVSENVQLVRSIFTHLWWHHAPIRSSLDIFLAHSLGVFSRTQQRRQSDGRYMTSAASLTGQSQSLAGLGPEYLNKMLLEYESTSALRSADCRPDSWAQSENQTRWSSI